jgi:hypothetical protein
VQSAAVASANQSEVICTDASGPLHVCDMEQADVDHVEKLVLARKLSVQVHVQRDVLLLEQL